MLLRHPFKIEVRPRGGASWETQGSGGGDDSDARDTIGVNLLKFFDEKRRRPWREISHHLMAQELQRRRPQELR